MERISGAKYEAAIGKYRPEQIVNHGTWTNVPDPESQLGLLHLIRQVRQAATTVTEVNPLDAASDPDTWQEAPEHCFGTLYPVGR